MWFGQRVYNIHFYVPGYAYLFSSLSLNEKRNNLALNSTSTTEFRNPS